MKYVRAYNDGNCWNVKTSDDGGISWTLHFQGSRDDCRNVMRNLVAAGYSPMNKL